MTYSLHLVTRPSDAEISTLVSLRASAFQSDQFSNFMLLGREEDTHERLMRQSIKTWLCEPVPELGLSRRKMRMETW